MGINIQQIYSGISAQIKSFLLKSLPGSNLRVVDLDLSTKWAQIAQNARFEATPGAVDKRSPVSQYNASSIASSPVTGLYRYYNESAGTNLWVSTCGTGAYVGNDATGTFTQIRAGLTSGKRNAFVTYQNLLIASSGYDVPWVYDGDTTNNVTWELGACKALASVASGSVGTGAYYYAVTIGSADQYVCGTVSNTTTSTSGSIGLSFIPLGPPGNTARKLYRTKSGGTQLYYLATISDNTTTTYSDLIADSAISVSIPATTDAMPQGYLLTLERDRLFMSGNPNQPNYIYYSEVYLPGYIQQTTQLTYMVVDNNDGDAITGIPIQLGIMVCIKRNSVRNLFITSPTGGADPTTWYAGDPVSWIGSPAPWSVVQTPSGIVFLGYDHWYLFDGASAQPIIDEFDTDDILPGSYNDTIAYYNNGILLAAYTEIGSASTAHNQIMRWNFRRQALAVDTWTSSTIYGANCFAGRTGDSEPGDLFYGDSQNGYVVKDQNSENVYSLVTQADANAGTLTNIFIGSQGTAGGAPYIEIGQTVQPLAIPNDICIFWDDPVTNPGTGWTEVTGYDGNCININSTVPPLTTDPGQPHTHILYGSIPLWTGITGNAGNGNPGAVGAHTHEVEYPCDPSTPLPRCVFLRLFRKNSNTTEYQFPQGSIVMYDQVAAPDGWISLQSEGFAGYYIALNQAGTEYAFAVANITTWPTVGATYSNNGSIFTITFSPLSGTYGTIYATSNSGDPQVSGNLIKVSGTGDATVGFSAWQSQAVALNNIEPSIHTHTFDIPTGTAAGTLAQSDSGTNCPAFGHDHVIIGELATTNMDTNNTNPWEVPNIGLNFIKLVGPTSSWDGYARNAYCLFAGSEAMTNGWTDATPSYSGSSYSLIVSSLGNGTWPAPGDTYTDGTNIYTITFAPISGATGVISASSSGTAPAASGTWTVVSTSVGAGTITFTSWTLPGLYLKIAGTSTVNSAGVTIPVSTLPTTLQNPQNQQHTHIAGTFTTSQDNASWGNGGYLATCYQDPHDHIVTLSTTSNDAGNPPSVSFRLGYKILGQMTPWNNAITQSYTSGLYVSNPQQINALSLDKLYWNQLVTGPNDSITFYVRTAATQAALSSATWYGPYTNPNGTDISKVPANAWFQYKINFVAANTMVTNPEVYFTDGYAVQYTYYQGAVNAESSVNFIYSIGLRNFSETPSSGPSCDKIFKKITSTHIGSAGAFTFTWATENATDSMVVSTLNNPTYWDSYFQSTAMGKEINMTISQNDLNPLKLKQLELFYSDMQVVI